MAKGSIVTLICFEYPNNFASPNAKDSTFALPNAKNTNMLVFLSLGDANLPCGHVHFIFCVQISYALATQREPHFQWNIGGVGSPTQNFRVGHVHFMLFMSGTQRKLVFQWNMGFNFFNYCLCCVSYNIISLWQVLGCLHILQYCFHFFSTEPDFLNVECFLLLSGQRLHQCDRPVFKWRTLHTRTPPCAMPVSPCLHRHIL